MTKKPTSPVMLRSLASLIWRHRLVECVSALTFWAHQLESCPETALDWHRARPCPDLDRRYPWSFSYNECIGQFAEPGKAFEKRGWLGNFVVVLCIDSRISVECLVIMSPKSDLAYPTAISYTKGIIKTLRGCRANNSESDDEGFKYRM